MGEGTDTGKGRNDAGKRNKSTIKKYLAKFQPVEPGNRYVFRGHPDSKWELTSTAYRRHDSPPHWEDFIKYNCELVDDAKDKNLHRKENRALNDIEVLAELRHYSAATALIDFTRDFLVALYFACQPIKPIKPIKTPRPPKGKVFIVNVGDTDKFLQLTPKDKEFTLEKILRFRTRDDDSGQNDAPDGKKLQTDKKTPELWYWEPRFEINNRLSSQKGVFIFGKDDIPCHQEIEIPGKDKEAIRNELNTWFGINEESLFNDLPGFAAMNDASHKRTTKTPTDYLMAGNEHFQRQEWEKALEQYDKAIDLNPKNSSAYSNRGLAKSVLGRHDEALADYNRAITLDPKDTHAYINRGTVKSGLGRHEEALADFTQAITLNPKHASAYINRGTVKSDLGQHEEALADFNQALTLNPKDAYAYNNRGKVKSDLGQHEEALADFNQALTLNPKDARAYNNRGTVNARLSRHEEAIDDYTQAITLNPKYAHAYNLRGNVKAVLGRHEEALADFTQALTLNLKFADAYCARGITKATLGQYEEAIADFTQALTLNPEDAHAYHFRGKIHATLANIPTARADLIKAVDLATKQGKKELAGTIQKDLDSLSPIP